MSEFLVFLSENILTTMSMGLSFIGSVIGIVSFIKNETKEQWKIFFTLFLIILFLGTTVYLTYLYFRLPDTYTNDETTSVESEEVQSDTDHIDFKDKDTSVQVVDGGIGEKNGENISGILGDILISGDGNTIYNNGNSSNTTQTTKEMSVTVSTVLLNKNDLSLCLGDTTDLQATVLYSDNSQGNYVKWISSNPKIATVDENGHIETIGVGITTITAQATKNNTSRSAICTITVGTFPTGYSISLSSNSVSFGSIFKVYIEPYEDNITEIIVYGKSPSGEIYKLGYDKTGYYVDSEIGTWTIYASVKNEFGTYEASKSSDFVTIKITPINIDSVFGEIV